MVTAREEGDQERHARLLARWQEAQDVEALDELLRGEVGELARKLRARVGDFSAGASASDLVQEAVGRWLGMEVPERFADVAGLRAFLWTAAWRMFLKRVERHGHAALRITPQESLTLSGAFATSGGLGRMANDEQRTALEMAVNLLRPEDRECLSLVYFQGLAIEEAARRVGIQRAAFDARLTRARRRLAERLVDWADVVG